MVEEIEKIESYEDEKIEVYEYDENNVLVCEDFIDSLEDLPSNYTTVRPSDGLYKATFDIETQTWFEGKTQEEFDKDAEEEASKPSQDDMDKAKRENEVIELLVDLGVI